MADTQEQYYTSGEYGGYQYEKLSTVIQDLEVQSLDTESYLSGVPRHLIVRNAKAALREVHKDVAKDFKAIEIEIGDDLMMVLPQDYVDYVRVSIVNSNSELIPLDINTRLNIAATYLQDNTGELLFDENGNVLESNESALSRNPYKSYKLNYSGGRAQFQTDTSKMSKNGEFTINEREGVIYFSSQLSGKDIVLEYVSDGMEWEKLQNTEITFHKNLKESVENLAYFKIIERKKSVPYNEKDRALRRYKTVRHAAKVKMANIDLWALVKVWRKGTVWVKA